MPDIKQALYEAVVGIIRDELAKVNPRPDDGEQPQTGTVPSAVVGKKWTVMAPFSKKGSTTSPENLPILQAEKDPRYKDVLRLVGGAVSFRATADGTHSANSKYPRCELREMKDEAWSNAAWSNKTGTHTIEGTYAVTHTFKARPQLAFVQIHDGGDDVLQVSVDRDTVALFYNDKKTRVELGTFKPGEKMKVKLVAKESKVEVYYNDEKRADVPKTGTSWYFKTGAYLQTNVTDWGEEAGAYGEVTIHALKVTHS
jgi:Ni/Co efflux regulator RcnB